tara:strand:- start:2757 stop:3509 length:753 start_codon:yes stop_codon:yes gene_type:complete
MKIFSFKSIIAFIMTILVLYSIFWIFLAFEFKSQITNFLNKSELISYESVKISISGFPHRIEIKMKNLTIEDNSKEIFKAHMPEVKFDINPVNLNKFVIRSKVLKSKIFLDDSKLDIEMSGVRSAILPGNEMLSETIVAINNADIIFNSLQMIEVEKIYFKQKNNGDFKGSINFSAEGKDFIASSSGGMKLELNGEYTFGNAKINGDLLLEVLNLKDHEKLFSAPIKIKDNVASFLFIPLIDLNELFNSF